MQALQAHCCETLSWCLITIAKAVHSNKPHDKGAVPTCSIAHYEALGPGHRALFRKVSLDDFPLLQN